MKKLSERQKRANLKERLEQKYLFKLYVNGTIIFLFGMFVGYLYCLNNV